MTGGTDTRSGPAPAPNHICAWYSDDRTWASLVSGFLAPALERGERLYYFADATDPDAVLSALADQGMDVRKARAQGRLDVFTADDTYLASGPFDPDAMVGQWHDATAQALADGCTGLRAIGEMSWCARDVPGADRLLEYELRIHREVFAKLPRLSALCLYDRRLIPDADTAVLTGAHRAVPVSPSGEAPPARPPLRALPHPHAPGLVLAGALDHDGRGTTRGAVAALTRMAADGDVELDLSELDFVDVVGAGMLSEAARALPAGRSLRISGAPATLHRLLGLFPELRAGLKVV
ncbi:MEDS domain-containing protein [Streptomyces sp. ODS05-4]|uniref:MEDS domain-containing protein n=1 Tax=Streptomyces sp. ODS05-4 TaxID=2944939 RepID=UPI00210AD7EE|nr:MEDS domain-containing protein [Streptomyces sp. ODS05-4]